MRVLLIGAFPFPYPQGSQVYAAEQAMALRSAGARVHLATYGRGTGTPPEQVDWIRSAPALAPRRTRSGPSLAKPVADAGLVASVVRAQRRERFDVALAHNAEAALVAQAARRLTGLRYVYVAHTLLAEELSAFAHPRHSGLLSRLGARIDRSVAHSADGVLALSRAGQRALERWAPGPVELIPPGLFASAPPTPSERRAARDALGLTPAGFFLYAGNLDGYQDLDLLDAAAARLGPDLPPVVVATHDAAGGERFRSLRVVESDFRTARCLACEANALVLPRRRPGGFPIKLLNYLESGRPVVAHADVADGLTDGVTGRLLPPGAREDAWADALRALAGAPEEASRIGAAGREHLLRTHDWGGLAERTLALCERALEKSGR